MKVVNLIGDFVLVMILLGRCFLEIVLHVHLASTSFTSLSWVETLFFVDSFWALTFDGYLVLISYPSKERMENG